MRNIISFTINVVPRSKKNSQQILVNPKTKRPFVSPSSAYKAYLKAALTMIPQDARQNIDYPVNVKAVYYMDTHRKVDKTNLEGALMDVLVDAGVLADDNCKIAAMTDGSRVSYDKEHPRTEVTITSLGVDYENP